MAISTINILLIEDNPGDIRLVEEILRESHEPTIQITVASSLEKAKKIIAAESIHAILLDLNLPDSQGLQTFKQVHRFSMRLPVIIMSVLSDKELIFQAMKEGAQDYLIKGHIENDSLIRAIRYASWSYHASH